MLLLVGAGAVGTILAGHLAQAGRETLKLYTRDKDLASFNSLRELHIDYAQRGHAPLALPRPELATSLELCCVEYLLICVKFPQLAALLKQLPAIPAGCTVVSTLNGAASLRLMRERWPQARVIPLTVMYNGQLLGPLHAQLTTRAEVIAGGDDCRLARLFRGSGMHARHADGDSAVWGKLLINLANALCALTHTTFKDLLTDPDLRMLYVEVLDEAVAVLNASGHDFQLPIAVPYRAYRQLLLRGGKIPWWFARAKNGLEEGAYPSMVSDVEHGRVTEVEQLNGEIVQLAAAYGQRAPVNQRIVAAVKQLQTNHPPQYLTPKQLRHELLRP
ncbi:MAG TPA: ketopantoate reductase C-terminal domain-containing protein [Nevskiaceae bacterium]|nr:ketopantoate reductase C-terminal domain-containing protein [Nevskiaceae bacterium]